jgi:hypothetical protein
VRESCRMEEEGERCRKRARKDREGDIEGTDERKL